MADHVAAGVLVANALLGAIPVLCFLATLERMDSFKLVRASIIFYSIAGGALAAVGAYFANNFLLARLNIEFSAYTHFVSPVVEESMKALLIVALIRTKRIGFMFDAVILGFAIGAGFALVENLYYLKTLGLHHPAVWVVRGFGTAIMHGGVAAIFAILAHLLTLKGERESFVLFLPGLIVAAALHSTFNFFLDYPVSSTVAMFLALAGAFALSLTRDRRSIHDWIEADFERHRLVLKALDEGRHEAIRLGHFMEAIRERAGATLRNDVLDYVRAHSQLVLRAEETLLARERGERVEIDAATKEKLIRLQELEKRIGKTALLALRAHLHFSRHEFFELYMLEKEAGFKRPRPHGA